MGLNRPVGLAPPCDFYNKKNKNRIFPNIFFFKHFYFEISRHKVLTAILPLLEVFYTHTCQKYGFRFLIEI